MMPTYIGVGERLVCNSCGVEVTVRALHDSYHKRMDEQMAELVRQIAELKRNTHNLVTV